MGTGPINILKSETVYKQTKAKENIKTAFFPLYSKLVNQLSSLPVVIGQHFLFAQMHPFGSTACLLLLSTYLLLKSGPMYFLTKLKKNLETNNNEQKNYFWIYNNSSVCGVCVRYYSANGKTFSNRGEVLIFPTDYWAAWCWGLENIPFVSLKPCWRVLLGDVKL